MGCHICGDLDHKRKDCLAKITGKPNDSREKTNSKRKADKAEGQGKFSVAFLSFEKNLIIPGKLLVGKASKTTTKFREYDTRSSSVYFYLVTCALRVNLHSAIA